MSSLLTRSPYQFSGTSASGSMRHLVPDRPNVVTVTIFPTLSGTATNEPISDQDLLHLDHLSR